MEKQDQLSELQEAMNQAKDRRLYERYLAVRLVLEGETMEEAGRIIGRRRQAVSSYLSAYLAGGIEGLALGHSTGKKPKLTAEQQEELAETIATRTPADVGFSARYNWTLALAAEYAKNRWGVSYSLRGMSILLGRQGLSNTRPTYTLEKADPEKQREFKEKTFPALKKS